MSSNVLDQFRLDDRVAIVTGGSRGLGRAIALGLAGAGARVVVASRKADACVAVVREIEAAGGEALAIPTHVGRTEDLERLVETTVAELGGISIVVTHAALDAMLVADRIVVLDDGVIVQDGSPSDVAARPRTHHVAALVGLNLVWGEAADGVITMPAGGSLVAADRLSTISYGEERPKHDNAREETRRLNRRAALTVNLTR